MTDSLDDFRISNEVRQKLQNEEWLKGELAKGRSPQEILEFSPESMAKFYAAALQLFEAHEYADAAHAFLFLVTLNSYNHDYWVGLGMSLQMCHQYESAIDAYELAAACKLESPVPFFYLAKCFFAVHDRDSAMEALKLAIEYSGDSEEYADLKQQALNAQSILQNRGNDLPGEGSVG